MRPWLAATLLFALASVAGIVSTRLCLAGGTTTTTTTTLLPSGCADAATYADILCRLDALITDVQSATDLGRLKSGILAAATKARKQAAKAADSSQSKVAKTQLKKCAHSLDSFRHKLDSNNAKKIIPLTTRETLRTSARDIKTDVGALRGTL